MSDTHVLFVVLCLLYLSDCVFWVHRHSVAFLTLTGTRWRLAFPSGMLGNSEGGLLLANPLPPLGPVYFGHLFPISLSPTHAYSHVSQTLGTAGRPGQMGVLLPYKDITAVGGSGRDVRINGKVFVRCRNAQQTGRLVEVLKRLLPLKEARRAAELQRILAEGFKVEEAKRKLAEYQQRALPIRILCNALFCLLFLISPALVWRYGLAQMIIPLALAIWVLAIGIVSIFWRVHKSLYPEGKEERISAAAKMILCPPIAARANDVLSSHVLAGYHLLAIASLLCGREDFEGFARRVILDLQHPMLGEQKEAEGVATERWYRLTLQKGVEDFLRRQGLDPKELLKPPARQDPASGSYCPRCEAEYAVPAGECADCPGVRLVAF